MKRITISQAAKMLDCGRHQVRQMIQLGKIPGATYVGELPRRTYYIYDEQIINFMKGEAHV